MEITNKTCRICLINIGKISLFDKQNDSDPLSELVLSTISVKIEFNACYPKTVCLDCVNRINISFKLKQEIYNSELKLQELCKSNTYWTNEIEDIKAELGDESSIDGFNDENISESISIPLNNIETVAIHTKLDSDSDSKLVSDRKKVRKRKKKGGINKFDQTSEKEKKCIECGKEFKCHANLLNHLRTHTGEKPFECDVCFKRFTQSGNLIIHQRYHSNEKRFICEICSKQFVQSGNLRQHMLTHATQQNFKCNVCTKAFRHMTSLKIHLHAHTGIKNHICGSCGKSFFRRNALTKHIRTVHYKEKKHVCSECNKAFSNTSNLQAHVRIHTGEKPFQCKFCDAKFNQSSPLVRHMLQHTKGKSKAKVNVEKSV